MDHGFIDKALSEIQEVSNLTWESDNLLRITRRSKTDFLAGVLWEKRLVKLDDVTSLLDSDVSVITNIPSSGLWSGDAIHACENRSVAWGRFGVLQSSIANYDDPSEHRDKQVYFAARGIQQHSRVVSFEFIFDKLFLAKLNNGKEVRIALVQAYDLTAEDLRDAHDKIGKFDVALKNNPNGRITPDSYDAAESMGVKVLKFGDLLGFLARGGD